MNSELSEHVPVMSREVVDLLGCRPDRNYLDLTVGGGGHAEAILEATSPAGRLVGADRDAEALVRAGERLGSFGGRVRLLSGSIRRARETLKAAELPQIDGVLIDCGLSSHQIDDPTRGFSFRRDGPLDMRMDRSTARTAREWLARAAPEEIADAIFQFGQERFARRIAKAVVAVRKDREITTTLELAEIIRGVVPRYGRGRDVDPATRTFQAIRIVVNDELTELEEGLGDLLELLPAGARIAVISFHSLEDRIVKTAFRRAVKERGARILTPKPLRPTDAETRSNRRARSARLRALEIEGGIA